MYRSFEICYEKINPSPKINRDKEVSPKLLMSPLYSPTKMLDLFFFRDHVPIGTLEDELRTTSVRPLLPGAQSDAIYGQRKTAILRKKEELMKKVAAWETQNSKQHTTQLDAEVIIKETILKHNCLSI